MKAKARICPRLSCMRHVGSTADHTFAVSRENAPIPYLRRRPGAAPPPPPGRARSPSDLGGWVLHVPLLIQGVGSMV